MAPANLDAHTYIMYLDAPVYTWGVQVHMVSLIGGGCVQVLAHPWVVEKDAHTYELGNSQRNMCAPVH